MKKLKLIGSSSNLKRNNITKSRYDRNLNTADNYLSSSPKRINPSRSNQLYSSTNKTNPLIKSTNNLNLVASLSRGNQDEADIRFLINEIIDKSTDIAEFHTIHQQHQNKFENRIVKKSINFITTDINSEIQVKRYNPKTSKLLICAKFKVIYHIDIHSKLSQYEIPLDRSVSNTSNKNNQTKFELKLQNIFEKERTLLDASLSNQSTEGENVRINLLYSNFNFCYVNLEFNTLKGKFKYKNINNLRCRE